MDQRVILGFGGRLQPDSMAEFAQHRATRLALGLEVLDCGPERLRVAVTGPEDLIDAFEMALSLGPKESLVRDVWRETNEGPVPPQGRMDP